MNGNSLKTFLSGFALGAVFAVLYAPSAGANTRKYLGERATDGKRRANEMFKKGYEKGRERWDDMAKAAESSMEEARGNGHL